MSKAASLVAKPCQQYSLMLLPLLHFRGFFWFFLRQPIKHFMTSKNMQKVEWYIYSVKLLLFIYVHVNCTYLGYDGWFLLQPFFVGFLKCGIEFYLFIFSILESHLEEEEDELTANDNDESCWQDEEQGNDQGTKKLNFFGRSKAIRTL